MSMIVTIGDEQQQQQDAGGSGDPEHPTEAQIAIDNFWPKMIEEVKKIKMIEPGNQILPLARIKKIMKLDEDVKMISAEAPLLFAKACEIFIHELTLRAWLHTDDNKRRTLQRNDIAMAISKYDQFDFLIDIVPRDEIKPKKENDVPKTNVVETPVQYCFQQIGGDVNAATNALNAAAATTVQHPQIVQTAAGGQLITSPMIIPIQQGQTAAALQTQLGLNGLMGATTAGQQIQGTIPQQLHLIQQIVGPNGEVTQIPVPLNQNQLNFIRAQMQLSPQTQATTTQTSAATQPIIITQAANQQFPQTQIIPQTQLSHQMGTSPNQIAFQTQQIQNNHAHQQQQQQQQQQTHQIITTTNQNPTNN